MDALDNSGQTLSIGDAVTYLGKPGVVLQLVVDGREMATGTDGKSHVVVPGTWHALVKGADYEVRVPAVFVGR